jgi:hypothetical protein
LYVEFFPRQLHEILANSRFLIFPPELHVIKMSIILAAAVGPISLDRDMATFSRLLP